MPARCIPTCCISLLLGLVARASADTTLTMRGAFPPPAGVVTAVDAQGVTIALSAPVVSPAPGAKTPPPKTPPGPPSPPAPTIVISWDQVASVQGDLASAAAPFMPTAEKLWRAKSRIDRGDLVGAEPLFEELFAQFVGKRGPTAAVAAGGLLRCRLGSGAQTAAVSPWLAYLNALGDNDTPSLPSPDPDPTAGPAVDPATGLAPSLPPIWVNLPSVQSLARGQWTIGTGARPRVAALAAYYEQAARFEAGLPVQVPTISIEHDEAVALVREVVVSRIGDDVQRVAARQALAARLKKRPPAWSEAWIRTALGRSLLVESARDSKLLGVAELVELPARLERVNPYLTGVALAEAAVALAKIGDAPGATQLRNELSDRFPGHPALEWEPLKGWAAPPAPAPAPVPAPISNSDSSKGGPS